MAGAPVPPGPRRPALRALAAVGIAALLLFAAIAVEVASGRRLTALDLQLARWLHQHATPALTTAMWIVTDLHSTFAITCYGAVALICVAWKRHWRAAALLVAGLGGGMLLNVVVKHAFQRARPVFDDPLLTLATYSFPSGHTAATTLFYGLLVARTFETTPSKPARALALLGAAAAIVLVAFTRMYLGAHYLSDVVAAVAEATAWLSLVFSMALLRPLGTSAHLQHQQQHGRARTARNGPAE
jgi:undecaprenyl-diphosphatase